ncbi:hypothetical protein ACERII_03075 [Evansella sp. AB-rgal1]
MTYPHQLMRMLLVEVEQVYRDFRN